LFTALRNRNFRLLWLGTLASFVGFVTSNVVQSVVAFQLTSRNQSVGMVVFARGLAQLLLAPLGGAVADRFSKRVILISAQGLTAAVFWVLAWLSYTDRLTVAHLTLSGFVIGLTFAFLGPTRSAYSIELSEPEWRSNAVALNQVAVNLSRVAGPAVASFLLGWHACGAAGAFFAMGALYGVAVLTQYRLPVAVTGVADPERGLLSDLLDGIQYVRGNAQLRALLVTFSIAVMLGMPYVTMLPGYVEHQLGMPSSRVSVLFSVSAVGGLFASFGAAWVAGTRHLVSAYRISGFVFGLSLVLPWFAHDMRLAALMLFGIGLASGAFTTLNGAVLLRFTEQRYMGRVMSIAMLSFGAFGLVGLPASALADAVGEGSAMAVLGVLVFLVLAAQNLVSARAPEPAE
jgi:MFS family permease